MDETYIKVQGQWKYLYRAANKDGDTVDFLFRAHWDKAAAQRYFEKAIDQNGAPGTVTVDKIGSNLAAAGRVLLAGYVSNPNDIDQASPSSVIATEPRTLL